MCKLVVSKDRVKASGYWVFLRLMTTFGWQQQHAKVKSTKSNPPSKVAKSAFMGKLTEQPPQAQIRSNAKYLCAHQIPNNKAIIMSTENVQKIHSRPKLWGFKKWCGEICQNSLTVSLFEQLPQAQIRSNAKYLCAHQVANDKTIILSTENVHKVHSRSKL